MIAAHTPIDSIVGMQLGDEEDVPVRLLQETRDTFFKIRTCGRQISNKNIQDSSKRIDLVCTRSHLKWSKLGLGAES